MIGISGLRTWIKGSVAPVLASESASSLLWSPAWPGTHWKLRATWEERESERSQIFQKDFGWRNAEAVERRASADWESVRKRSTNVCCTNEVVQSPTILQVVSRNSETTFPRGPTFRSLLIVCCGSRYVGRTTLRLQNRAHLTVNPQQTNNYLPNFFLNASVKKMPKHHRFRNVNLQLSYNSYKIRIVLIIMTTNNFPFFAGHEVRSISQR